MVVSDSLVCAGSLCDAPAGLRLRTFRSSEVVAFEGKPRKVPVSEIVLHETVTRDVRTTLRVLKRRRLGVHFIIGPAGDVTQHADPALTRLEHAAPHNVRSVGIEIVNPVEVRFMKSGLAWNEYLVAPWAVGGKYVLPTPAQVEAAAQLVQWLTSPTATGLQIPRDWIGRVGDTLTMGRVPGARARKPGIYAHSAFHHADGAWPLLYAYLRLERGLGAEKAYDLARSIGTSRRPRVAPTLTTKPKGSGAQEGTAWSSN